MSNHASSHPQERIMLPRGCSWMRENINKKIDIIKRSHLQSHQAEVATDEHKLICSYTQVDLGSQIFNVPDTPPRLVIPGQVLPDPGQPGPVQPAQNPDNEDDEADGLGSELDLDGLEDLDDMDVDDILEPASTGQRAEAEERALFSALSGFLEEQSDENLLEVLEEHVPEYLAHAHVPSPLLDAVPEPASHAPAQAEQGIGAANMPLWASNPGRMRLSIPRRPFEAALRAAHMHNPQTRFNDVDVIINNITMTRLFQWCLGIQIKPFRLVIHIVESTLIVEESVQNTRAALREFLSRKGKWFPSFQNFITQRGDDTVGFHRRMIQYQFGGLEIAVLSQADAFVLPEGVTNVNGSDETNSPMVADEESEGVEVPVPQTPFQILEVLSGNLACPVNEFPDSEVVMQKNGTDIDCNNMTDMKISSSVAELAVHDDTNLPSLWFSRTRNFVTGHSTDARDLSVKVKDVIDDLYEMPDYPENQQALQKLAMLLRRFSLAVRNNQDAPCILVVQSGRLNSTKGGIIKVHSMRERRDPLPRSIVKTMWSTLPTLENSVQRRTSDAVTLP